MTSCPSYWPTGPVAESPLMLAAAGMQRQVEPGVLPWARSPDAGFRYF